MSTDAVEVNNETTVITESLIRFHFVMLFHLLLYVAYRMY